MKAELQKRLVAFAVSVILLSKYIPADFALKHLYGQLIRSATSSGLNYGEAQAAETRKDFIHKLGIVLIELKETEINLEMIIQTGLCERNKPFLESLSECRELIAIFAATIKTARKNIVSG
jgi:four helix bundle protein